jgi:hypothetical protein
MSDIANKLITLELNSSWKALCYKTVKDAFISLTGSETKPEPNTLAIDIQYELDADNNPIFENVIEMRPVAWSEWITLPIREWDLSISGANRSYRVPTVIVAINYDKMPRKEFGAKPSKEEILRRDNFTCQYTNEKLPREMLNVDHIDPKSKGGEDTWENLVCARRDLNTIKGNKLNSEIGLKLIRKPFKPKPIDKMYLIGEARHNDHNHFIIK